MNGREKCRCISVFLVALMAIAGVVAMIYGGVQIFKVSQSAATEDGANVADILEPFVKCSDYHGPTGAWSSDVIDHAVRFQCNAKQIPAKALIGFASAFMILALCCVPCAFKKDKMFGFTMWSTLSMATIVMSVVFVSVYALPAAAQMASDCSKYDAATITELQNLGIVCLKGVEGQPNKTTALKWFCKLHTFYAGSALCIASLLLFFMCKHCCCCNPNASSCCRSNSPAAGGEQPCPIRRAVDSLKARFCSRHRAAIANSADQLPVSAPSYYQVNESSEGASEDAGASSSNQYYGVN